MKTATDRAVEAIEAAEKIFAEENACHLGPDPGGKSGPDRDDYRCDPGRRRRREAAAQMGAVVLAPAFGLTAPLVNRPWGRRVL